jgi:hypothetical protein
MTDILALLQSIQNNDAVIEPDHYSDDRDDGTGHDAGAIALDLEKRQLPERTAFPS